jgi:hypothetical protein
MDTLHIPALTRVDDTGSISSVEGSGVNRHDTCSGVHGRQDLWWHAVMLLSA